MSKNQSNRNGAPVTDINWSLQAQKVMTFAGATTDDPGEYDGAGNPATLFTVTGTCLVRILAKCTTTLTGASATLEVGTALDTDGLIANTTGTDIDVNEIWHDASPDNSIEAPTVLAQKIVSDNIIQTVATADVTAGVIEYTAIWYPLTPDSSVVAA